MLVSFLWPAQNKDLLARLGSRRATAFAMDCVPRITRAQKMDALSAMGNIAGYRRSSKQPSTSAGSYPAR